MRLRTPTLSVVARVIPCLIACALGTEEVILIHHTDCGMLTFEDADFRLHIQEETGIKPSWSAETFSNLEDDVRQSIARIRNSPFIPKKDHVRGFIYDVHTGRLEEVT